MEKSQTKCINSEFSEALKDKEAFIDKVKKEGFVRRFNSFNKSSEDNIYIGKNNIPYLTKD